MHGIDFASSSSTINLRKGQRRFAAPISAVNLSQMFIGGFEFFPFTTNVSLALSRTQAAYLLQMLHPQATLNQLQLG